MISVELAHALARVRRFDEAIRHIRKAQEFEPDRAQLRQALALTHLRRGDTAGAIAILDQGSGSPSTWKPWFGYVWGIAGRRQQARDLLRELERRARSRYVSPQHFAVVHLGLGERDQALKLLDRAYDERAFEMMGFSGPVADLLLDDPRFQQLLKRMGLEGQPGYAPRVRR